MNLGVVLRAISLHEWIVGNGESESVQALELEFVEGVGTVNDWVHDILLFLLDGIDIGVKCFSLLSLEFSQFFSTFHHLAEFAGEGRNFNWHARVENEVDDSAVNALDETRLLAMALLAYHQRLDTRLLLAENLELVGAYLVDNGTRLAELLGVGENRAEKLVFKGHSELVLETVTPVRLIGQLGHCAHEAA